MRNLQILKFLRNPTNAMPPNAISAFLNRWSPVKSVICTFGLCSCTCLSLVRHKPSVSPIHIYPPYLHEMLIGKLQVFKKCTPPMRLSYCLRIGHGSRVKKGLSTEEPTGTEMCSRYSMHLNMSQYLTCGICHVPPTWNLMVPILVACSYHAEQ